MEQIILTFSAFEESFNQVIFNHGIWTYFLLFLLIFSETALIFLSFLPGDSILLAVGAFSNGTLDIWLILPLLTTAAIIGNICSYGFGFLIGKKAFESKNGKLFNGENLLKAHAFFEKYGAITITVARFLPIIRAFAPFIAGIGRMDFRKFMAYNVLGSVLWVFSFAIAGLLFGKIPFFKENTLFVVTIILVVSIVLFPIVSAIISSIRNKPKKI